MIDSPDENKVVVDETGTFDPKRAVMARHCGRVLEKLVEPVDGDVRPQVYSDPDFHASITSPSA